jgi:hypothetical protein
MTFETKRFQHFVEEMYLSINFYDLDFGASVLILLSWLASWRVERRISRIVATGKGSQSILLLLPGHPALSSFAR